MAQDNIARILVADDLEYGDDGGERRVPSAQLRVAADLAGPLHSSISLVHAYDLPEIVPLPPSVAVLEGPYVAELKRALDDESSQLREDRPALDIVPSVEKGDAVAVLLADIARLGCDLVVVGTHGRRGLQRVVLGSVAEEVIRRAPIPALSLNPMSAPEPQYRPSRILVALDFSASMHGVLDAAAKFARAFGAALVLATVIEEWVYPVVQSASLLAGGFVMPLERDLREYANLRDEQLRELAAPLVASGLRVETRLIERAPSVSAALLGEARASQCDLVVVGHRHASRLEYALLGSVSRNVIRDASCPVLAVPSRH